MIIPHDPDYGTYVYLDNKPKGLRRFFYRFSFKHITKPEGLRGDDRIKLTNAFGELDDAVVLYVSNDRKLGLAESRNFPDAWFYLLSFSSQQGFWICDATLLKPKK